MAKSYRNMDIKRSREVTKYGLQDVNGPLSAMQRQYVINVVHHKMGKVAAANAAGYSSGSNSLGQLNKNAKIQAAIAKERELFAKASEMSKKKVIDGFMEAVDLARIKGEPLAMVAGWREIGKMCGFYEPQKVNLQVSVQGQVLLQRLNTMSDSELLALAENDPTVLEGEFDVVSE